MIKLIEKGNRLLVEYNGIRSCFPFSFNVSCSRIIIEHKGFSQNIEGILSDFVDGDDNEFPNLDSVETLLARYSGFKTASGGSEAFLFISNKNDLPLPVEGVITLRDNYTYLFTTEVDLMGDRLVCGENTTILGGSSENCRIKSTGLTDALISSEYSLPIRGITIEAQTALNLSGNSTTSAIDWFGVNFTNCANVGLIENYSNVIMTDCAFLNSGGLTFNGQIGTVAFNSCLFDCNAGNTIFILPSTLTITRRFRIIYSSLVVLSGETAINMSTSASIPVEGYILDTVNFSGGGIYLVGVQNTDNKSLFVSCRGIENSGSIAQYYMTNNVTATTISATNTFVKIAGITIPGTYVEKFNTATTNRAIYIGALTGFYKITVSVSAVAGNNQLLLFRIAKNGTTLAQSEVQETTSGNGRSQTLIVQDVVQLVTNDFIEIFVANGTATSNITVEQLNVIVERLN